MTVSDLIAELMKMPGEAVVVVCAGDQSGDVIAEEVSANVLDASWARELGGSLPVGQAVVSIR